MRIRKKWIPANPDGTTKMFSERRPSFPTTFGPAKALDPIHLDIFPCPFVYSTVHGQPPGMRIIRKRKFFKNILQQGRFITDVL